MSIDRHRILRLPEMLQMTGLSRSTLYRMVKAGTFPPRYSLGSGQSAGGRRMSGTGWKAIL